MLHFYINCDQNVRNVFPWTYCVQNIITKCGMMNILKNPNFPNIKWLTLNIRQKLSDLFISE